MTVAGSRRVRRWAARLALIVAARFGWRPADAAACFADLDPSPLFCDAVHLTPEGSRRFADCVAAAVKD